jgi:hypothetical protein
MKINSYYIFQVQHEKMYLMLYKYCFNRHDIQMLCGNVLTDEGARGF